MSIIDEIENAPMGDSGGRYLPPGFIGQVRVEQVQEYKTRAKGDAFIVEFEVLESNLPEVEVGATYSWYQKMNDSAPREIKNFLAAAKGFDPHTPAGQDGFKRAFSGKAGGQLYSAAISKDNALGDSVVGLETYAKKMKNGGDFTVHRFAPGVIRTAVDPRAEWERDPSGAWVLNPATNDWEAA